jgi:hypothetical protein
VKKVSGRGDELVRRSVGGRLHLEPKFRIDHFQGKRYLDIGCGASLEEDAGIARSAGQNWDVSEQGSRSVCRFTSDAENLNLFDIISKREDLHAAFDFTLYWRVIMCIHNPIGL